MMSEQQGQSAEPLLQYFNDAQYYALAMNTRDEVIVAGRGVGKGAIQARRLQSCFQYSTPARNLFAQS